MIRLADCLVPLIPLLGFPLLSAANPDLADHPGFAHAMEVVTRDVDGFPVVFHYGQVRPEFASSVTSPTRSRLDLNEDWLFRFDPEASGIREDWQGDDMPPGAWVKVAVPHCWDMMPGGRFHDWSDTSPANPPHYNGAAWYRREWIHSPAPERRHRLEFLGVQQRARVFLNGREIALHEGGGQPFSMDVTESLRDGRNVLALQVIRRANHEAYDSSPGKEPKEIEQTHGPHPKAPDNWPYAGITRSVHLISESPVTLRKLQIQAASGKLEAAVILTNHGSKAFDGFMEFASPALASPGRRGLDVSIAPGQVRVFRLNEQLRADAAAWSPESPSLHAYAARLKSGATVIDEVRGYFGIRSFSIEEGRFMLDGKPVFLKGIAVYEETRDRGSALLPADHRRLMELAKAADANFLRLHVGQRDPYAYELADRMGFMVTAEWGGFWYREKAMDAQTRDEKSVFQSHARCALWDLMNHPSVVMWCTHNESHQFCPEYERFVAMATGLVRRHDWQKRPVTWAAWHPHKGQPHFEHADVVGFNQYRGAMDPFEDLDPDLQRATRENPGKPLLILENGAWSTLGQRGRPDQKGTEDWQADLLKRQHAVLTRHRPPLAGYTYWLLCDYRSRKFYAANERNGGYSHMGLYSPDGEPKLVRDVFRDLEW